MNGLQKFEKLLPLNWTKKSFDGKIYDLVTLDENHNEYKHAKLVFQQNSINLLDKHITEIKRIESPINYMIVFIEKEKYIFCNKTVPQEEFHIVPVCNTCIQRILTSNHKERITCSCERSPKESGIFLIERKYLQYCRSQPSYFEYIIYTKEMKELTDIFA